MSVPEKQGPMVVETKRESIAEKKVGRIPLSKEESSFLRDFREARKDIQERNDFTRLNALTPIVDKMVEAGTFQKLRPLIDGIVANTISTMPIPSGGNYQETHGEVSLGEIQAAMDEEDISS